MLGSALSRKRDIRNAKNGSVNAKNKHLKISNVEKVSRACKNVYRKYKLCELFWMPITCLSPPDKVQSVLVVFVSSILWHTKYACNTCFSVHESWLNYPDNVSCVWHTKNIHCSVLFPILSHGLQISGRGRNGSVRDRGLNWSRVEQER